MSIFVKGEGAKKIHSGLFVYSKKGKYELDKNDRRSSGGTLLQKFNLIDIWHITFEI